MEHNSLEGVENPESDNKINRMKAAIVECRGCLRDLIIRQAGRFRCPECKIIGKLYEDGSIKFRENLGEVAIHKVKNYKKLKSGLISAECPICRTSFKLPKPGKFECFNCWAISELGID